MMQTKKYSIQHVFQEIKRVINKIAHMSCSISFLVHSKYNSYIIFSYILIVNHLGKIFCTEKTVGHIHSKREIKNTSVFKHNQHKIMTSKNL